MKSTTDATYSGVCEVTHSLDKRSVPEPTHAMLSLLFVAWCILLALIVPLVGGCGSGIFVAVSSVSVNCASTVQSGGTLQCTAAVNGIGSPSQSVKWTASSGMVTSSGLFTAPTVSSATQVSITATSVQDGSKSGSASVNVTPIPVAPSINSVTAICAPTSLQPGQTSSCTANVQGSGAFNPAVTWSSTSGTISQSGIFTAPSVSTSTTAIITATSVQDSTRYGVATVSVVPNAVTSVAVTCNPTALQPAQTTQCVANVQGTGSFNTAVTWSATAGTITSSGLFTAPIVAAATQITITAASVQQGIPGSASITVTAPVPTISLVTVSCIPPTLQSGQTSQCSATVQGTGAYNSAISWSVTGGTITTSGLFTAPVVSSTTSFAVTATSVQDGSKGGSAPITVNPAPAPDISEFARRQAVSSAYLGAVVDDPEALLPQLALANAVSANISVFQATALAATFATYRTQMATWESTNQSETELTGLRQGFEILRQLSVKGVSPAVYAAAVLNADVNLLSTVDAPGTGVTSDGAWAEQRNGLIDTLLTSLAAGCATQANYCDTALGSIASNVPSMGASITSVCSSARSAVVPCQFLQQAASSGAATAFTTDSLQSSVGTTASGVASDAQACINGQSNCSTNDASGGKDKSTQLTNLGSAVATIGTKLNLLTSQQASEIKTLASGTSTLYKESVKLYNTLSNPGFSIASLEQQNFSGIIDFIFSTGDSTNTTLTNVVNLVTSLASIETNMAGAVTSILKIFGGASGSNDNAAVLSAIQSLKNMIQALQHDMDTQFAIVDVRLANLSVSMTNGFTLVDDKLNNVAVTQLQIQGAISDLDSQVEWLATSASADAQSIERATLNLAILGLQTPVSQDEFARELAILTQYITTVSGDATFAGSNYNYTTLGIYTTLSEHESDFNRSYLAGLAQAALKGRSYGSNLANSTEVLYAGNLYLALIQQYPQFASAEGATIAKQVNSIVPVITAINQTTMLIQGDSSLVPNLLNAYTGALASLQSTINGSVPGYLTSIAVSGQNLSAINLYAGPTQPNISYVPQVVQAGLIPPCGSAVGQNLQMVSNWKSLIPTDVLAAEALGLGTIHVCYSLLGTTNGWSDYYEYKIKVGEYQAFGDLAVAIQVSLNSTLVRTYEVDYPAGLPYGRTGFCFFSNTGGIQVAPTQVPAWTVLNAAWTGTFNGEGTYCSGASVSNLKAVFESTGRETYDWTTAALTNASSNLTAVSNALLALQNGWNNYVSAQLGTTGTTIATSAEGMIGYRLALTQYIDIAYGNLLATNVPLQNVINGSNAIPTVETLQALYSGASAQTQLTASPIDFVTPVSTPEQAILGVIKTNSPEAYQDPDLTALLTKLNLAVSSLN